MTSRLHKRSVVLLVVAAGTAVLLTTAGVVVARAGNHATSHATSVSVIEKEMKISLKPSVVDAGKVTFVVRNAGTVEHEMVVVRGAGKLAVKNFEAVEKASPGEVEGVKPGKAKQLTLKLSPGKYLIICNIPGHYMLGMRSVLTVR
jgi:uncharacterized cupredoxin-like copper-binding protein